jgi:hypothetical protein
MEEKKTEKNPKPTKMRRCQVKIEIRGETSPQKPAEVAACCCFVSIFIRVRSRCLRDFVIRNEFAFGLRIIFTSSLTFEVEIHAKHRRRAFLVFVVLVWRFEWTLGPLGGVGVAKFVLWIAKRFAATALKITAN